MFSVNVKRNQENRVCSWHTLNLFSLLFCTVIIPNLFSNKLFEKKNSSYWRLVKSSMWQKMSLLFNVNLSEWLRLIGTLLWKYSLIRAMTEHISAMCIKNQMWNQNLKKNSILVQKCQSIEIMKANPYLHKEQPIFQFLLEHKWISNEFEL